MSSKSDNRNNKIKTFSRYRVLDVLGEGGMGIVYLAEDPVLLRKLAIKVISIDPQLDSSVRDEYIKRFLIEARASAKLSHPCIVNVHDVGEEDGVPWIAFELVDGESLEELLQREGKIDIKRAVSIVIDVASALQHSHELSIIHRDVKPANILLTKNGIAKLTDFGIAKAPWANLTQEGITVGSPGYMSPEQIKGQELDGRSDLFSLCVVFYEMLTGKQPFLRDSVENTALATLSGAYVEIQDLIDIPSMINYIVTLGLASTPEKRISSANEMIEILQSSDLSDQKSFSSSTQSILESETNSLELHTRIKEKAIQSKSASFATHAIQQKHSLKVIFSGFNKKIIASFLMFFNNFSTHKKKKIIFASVFSIVFFFSIIGFILIKEAPKNVTSSKNTNQLPKNVEKYLQNVVKEGSIDEAIHACLELDKAGFECPQKRLISETKKSLNDNNIIKAEKIVKCISQLKHTIDGLLLEGRLDIRNEKYNKTLKIFKLVKEQRNGKTALQAELNDIIADFSNQLKMKKAPPSLIKLVLFTLNSPNHPQIISWLQNKNYWLRWNAVSIMKSVSLPIDMLPVYVLDLKYAGTWKTRKKAAKLLGNLGDKRAIPALEEAKKKGLRDPIVASTASFVLRNVFNK